MRNAERGARWSRNRLIILVRIAQMETAARIKRGCIIRLVVMRGIRNTHKTHRGRERWATGDGGRQTIRVGGCSGRCLDFVKTVLNFGGP